MDENWVKFNPLTHCYESKDGTVVSADVAESVACLADVLQIASIREKQRKDMNVKKSVDTGDS